MTLILSLLFLIADLSGYVDANPNSQKPPVLAMPEEYIKYTISRVNGTWLAEIDGTYPLYFLEASGDVASCIPSELPMVYPTPPNTTNIKIWMNGTELAWSNWYYDKHHTAIGDWEMIYCDIKPTSEFFLLTIHYEHPIEIVNGSNMFLYDLNIREYLTDLSNTSLAYFTIEFETSASNIRAYTTYTDNIWKSKEFELDKEGDKETVSLQMLSTIGEPLAGDLVVMFNDSTNPIQNDVPYWLILILIFVASAFLAAVIYRKKH